MEKKVAPITEIWIGFSSEDIMKKHKNEIVKLIYLEDDYVKLIQINDRIGRFDLDDDDYQMIVKINEEKYWFSLTSSYFIPERIDRFTIEDWENTVMEINDLIPNGHFIVTVKKRRQDDIKKIRFIYKTYQRFARPNDTFNIKRTIGLLKKDHKTYFYRLISALFEALDSGNNFSILAEFQKILSAAL